MLLYIIISWFCQIWTKSHTEPFYTDLVYRWDYPDTDMDDKIAKNSHHVIHSIASLSGYWYGDVE